MKFYCQACIFLGQLPHPQQNQSRKTKIRQQQIQTTDLALASAAILVQGSIGRNIQENMTDSGLGKRVIRNIKFLLYTYRINMHQLISNRP